MYRGYNENFIVPTSCSTNTPLAVQQSRSTRARRNPSPRMVEVTFSRRFLSGKDVPTEWHDRTNRAVFMWQEPRWKGGTVSYEDQKSTWNSGVWKAIRRGSAEEEVRRHRDRVTGSWKQISKQRQQVDVSYDPSMVTLYSMVHAWMRRVSKRLVSGRRKKAETSTSLSTLHG